MSGLAPPHSPSTSSLIAMVTTSSLMDRRLELCSQSQTFTAHAPGAPISSRWAHHCPTRASRPPGPGVLPRGLPPGCVRSPTGSLLSSGLPTPSRGFGLGSSRSCHRCSWDTTRQTAARQTGLDPRGARVPRQQPDETGTRTGPGRAGTPPAVHRDPPLQVRGERRDRSPARARPPSPSPAVRVPAQRPAAPSPAGPTRPDPAAPPLPPRKATAAAAETRGPEPAPPRLPSSPPRAAP